MKKLKSIKTVEYRGENYTISELAEVCNLPPRTLYSRLKNGWSVDDATTTPVRFNNQKAHDQLFEWKRELKARVGREERLKKWGYKEHKYYEAKE